MSDTTKAHVLYECGICGEMHSWDFDGDCRDDDNRYFDAEDYAAYHEVSEDEVEVRSWDERQAADVGRDADGAQDRED